MPDVLKSEQEFVRMSIALVAELSVVVAAVYQRVTKSSASANRFIPIFLLMQRTKFPININNQQGRPMKNIRYPYTTCIGPRVVRLYSAKRSYRRTASNGSGQHRKGCAMRILLTAFVLGLMFSGAKTQTLPWIDQFDGELQPGWFWVNEDPSLHWFKNEALYFEIGSNSNGFKNRLLRPAPAGLYSIICYGRNVGKYKGQEIRTLLYTDDENYASLEWNPSRRAGDFYVKDHGVGKRWSVSESYPNDVGLFALGYVPELGSIHVLMGTISVYPYYEAPLDSVLQISFVPHYVGFEAVGSSGDTIVVGDNYNGFTIHEFPYTRPPKITNFSEVGGDLRVDWQTDYPIPTLPSAWVFEVQLKSSVMDPLVSPQLPSSSTSYTFTAPDCHGCVKFNAYVEHIPTYIPVGERTYTRPWEINERINTPSVSYDCPRDPLVADFRPIQDPMGSPIVKFEDLSSGQPVSWEWNFGDGTPTDANQNPTHFFPAGCSQDYSVSLTVESEGGCSDIVAFEVGITPTEEFPPPKALFISGHPNPKVGKKVFDQYKTEVEKALKGQGWIVKSLEDPTYADIVSALEGEEYRGLYFVGHGNGDNGVSKILIRDSIGQDYLVLPPEIGVILEDREMDFVTVIACQQSKNQWQNAFNGKASNLTLPSKTFYGSEGPYADEIIELQALKKGYGVSTKACNTGNTDNKIYKSYLAKGLGEMKIDDSETTCSSFLYYSNGKFGDDLFPVRSCQSDIGAPYEGSIMIEAPDGTFTVRAVFPSAYQDTVALSATCFEEVPSSLKTEKAVSLSRYLCFAAVTSDSTIQPDQYDIQMKYEDSDLMQAGIASEAQLRIGFVSSNGEFSWVETEQDTVANIFKFVVTEYGVVGIYGEVNAPVPVELASFSVQINENNAFLSWTTQSESNNYGFAIERKEELGSWQQIGFVRGSGTTTIPQQYTYRDDDLAVGTYSYRLKQIDTDGAIEYSETVNVSVLVPEVFFLDQNYPNPFNPITTIEYDLPTSIPVRLVVYDLLGKHVRTLVDKRQQPGHFKATWDGTDEHGNLMASGIYLCRMEAGNYSKGIKLVLIR
jgi:PKD repeat protein